jgi:hypothetical protein
VNESRAAIAFYAGLGAFIFGIFRVTAASVEGNRRDVLGIVAIAVGGVLFALTIAVYLHSGKQVLPF